jgi:hypothetical protein
MYVYPSVSKLLRVRIGLTEEEEEEEEEEEKHS